MNFRDYKRHLISTTKGNISRSVVKGWKKNWKIYKKIRIEESQPPVKWDPAFLWIRQI